MPATQLAPLLRWRLALHCCCPMEEGAVIQQPQGQAVWVQPAAAVLGLGLQQQVILRLAPLLEVVPPVPQLLALV